MSAFPLNTIWILVTVNLYYLQFAILYDIIYKYGFPTQVMLTVVW